jgi:hypothetical protein
MAVPQMSRDPPATLDEPDQDWQVVIKLRARIETLENALTQEELDHADAEAAYAIAADRIEALETSLRKIFAKCDAAPSSKLAQDIKNMIRAALDKDMGK